MDEERRDKAKDGSIVISLRLDPALAEAFRVEAARRSIRLNKLFAEIWNLYKGQPCASTR